MIGRPTFLVAALAVTNWLSNAGVTAAAFEEPASTAPYRIALDRGHPWRPPFGLERVIRPLAIVVEAAAAPAPANYFITAYFKGKQGPSYPIRFPAQPP